MQRFPSSGLFAVGCLLILTDCGAVLWTQTPNRPPHEIDGAILSYALAEGTLAVQGEIKNGELTLVTNQKVVARPDSSHMYAVVYSHSPFSKDEINIQVDSGLVRSISSTTADKSVEIVKGITSLLSQVSATKAALEQAAAPPGAGVENLKPVCADMKVTDIHNVTYNKGVRYITKPAQPKNEPQQKKCDIIFRVTEKIVSRPLGVLGFPRPSDRQLLRSEICDYTYAFCFRLGAIFQIEVTAHVCDIKDIDIKDKDCKNRITSASLPSFEVAAPLAGRLGYVRFDRRAFVANKTELKFDNTGLMSGFSATNPSEVLGFLVLPTAIAAGVAVAAALH